MVREQKQVCQGCRLFRHILNIRKLAESCKGSDFYMDLNRVDLGDQPVNKYTSNGCKKRNTTKWQFSYDFIFVRLLELQHKMSSKPSVASLALQHSWWLMEFFHRIPALRSLRHLIPRIIRSLLYIYISNSQTESLQNFQKGNFTMKF